MQSRSPLAQNKMPKKYNVTIKVEDSEIPGRYVEVEFEECSEAKIEDNPIIKPILKSLKETFPL